jgi:hypothetical protein
MVNETATVLKGIEVSDVTGQKRMSVSNIPTDATVSELVQELMVELQLAKHDVGGRPLVYHARLDREGRHLHGSEVVGESLTSGDTVVLTPNIEAGSGA